MPPIRRTQQAAPQGAVMGWGRPPRPYAEVKGKSGRHFIFRHALHISHVREMAPGSRLRVAVLDRARYGDPRVVRPPRGWHRAATALEGLVHTFIKTGEVGTVAGVWVGGGAVAGPAAWHVSADNGRTWEPFPTDAASRSHKGHWWLGWNGPMLLLEALVSRHKRLRWDSTAQPASAIACPFRIRKSSQR